MELIMIGVAFSLTVPFSPAGFSVDVHTNSRQRVSLTGSLTIAIEAMYLLTLLPWEGALREVFPVASGQIAEEIYFKPTVAPDADEQMDTQHMVIGLFVGCQNVAAQHHDPAYATTVVVNLRGSQLGVIYIRPIRRNVGAIADDRAKQTDLLLDDEGQPMNTAAYDPHGLSGNHGAFADPEDPEFRINYRFTGRNNERNPYDILLAALDGIANAAPYESDAHVALLKGTDGRQIRSTHIVVERVGRVDPGVKPLTYGYAARAMQLIIRLMRLQNRYQTIEFILSHRTIRFAEGSVTRPRAEVGGENWIAASVE